MAAQDKYPAWRPEEIRWSDEIDQFVITWSGGGGVIKR